MIPDYSDNATRDQVMIAASNIAISLATSADAIAESFSLAMYGFSTIDNSTDCLGHRQLTNSLANRLNNLTYKLLPKESPLKLYAANFFFPAKAIKKDEYKLRPAMLNYNQKLIKQPFSKGFNRGNRL